MNSNTHCVYLTMYYGDKMPGMYVGSTSIERHFKGYKGSVSSRSYKDIFRSEIKEHPELFDTFIISEHENHVKAKEEELRLQILHNVVKSKDWINMALAQENGCYGSGQGVPHTPESKAKMSIKATGRVSPNKGKPLWTEEQKKAHSEKMKGRPSKRKGIIGSNRGVPKTEECKANMRASKTPELRAKASAIMKKIRSERFWSTTKI